MMANLTGVLRQPIGTLRYAWRRRFRRTIPEQFQPYNNTLPDRYPWLFRSAADQLGADQPLRLLSFGCSRGDEVIALRKYFPVAAIKGIDVDPRNIAACRKRARSTGATFSVAGTTYSESAESYDAVFCLAVLCHGDLTIDDAECSDALFPFDDFNRTVSDFARCLKPGGLLLLLSTNYRFCDTTAAADFEVILETGLENPDGNVKFGPDNRRLRGLQYRPVAFRKRKLPAA